MGGGGAALIPPRARSRYAGVLVSRRQYGQASTEHDTPLYKFAFSSVSNIVSSVSQYEALKYVSFPTQVVTMAKPLTLPLHCRYITVTYLPT